MSRAIKAICLFAVLCVTSATAFADHQCSTSTPGVGGSPGETVSIAYDPGTGTVTIGVTGGGSVVNKVYVKLGVNGTYTEVTYNDSDTSGATFKFIDTYLMSGGTDDVYYKAIVRIDGACFELIYKFTPDVPPADTAVAQVGTTTAVPCP